MTLANCPRVTVLMPVCNAASHLLDAIQSILGQTFIDFEFLIIDDGSTDDSVALIKNFQDARIRLMHNEVNLGLVASLNRGLESARGEYIARMDADDISRPGRLAKLVNYMDKNPEVGVCGSWVRFIPEANRYIWKLPKGSEEIRCWLFSSVGVAHPAVMMRRKLFVENGLFYDPDYRHIEDYELWGRAIKYMEFANIQEVLLDYRIGPDQICARHESDQMATVVRLRAERLRELGINPSSPEQELHEAIMNCRIPADKDFLDRAEQWLLRLESANKAVGKYNLEIFARRMLEIWFSICSTLPDNGICSWKRCRNSTLWSNAEVSLWYRIRASGAWIIERGFGLRHGR